MPQKLRQTRNVWHFVTIRNYNIIFKNKLFHYSVIHSPFQSCIIKENVSARQTGRGAIMKKYMKIIGSILLFGVIAGLLWFCNVMLGNPVSHALAAKAAKVFLADQFSGTDYQIERITYSFKDGAYHAFIASPTSIDGDFSVSFTMLGKYRWDSYASVLDGFNTAQRLNSEYRKLTDTVLNDPSLPYDNTQIYSIMFGELEIYPREAFEDPNVTDVPEYALIQEDLEINGIYDVKELGAKAGHLVLYVDNETVSVEETARIILDFKTRFDEAGIPFYAMDFVLRHPRTEDGNSNNEEIRINDFLYEDIYEDGLTERLNIAIKDTANYFAMLDQTK